MCLECQVFETNSDVITNKETLLEIHKQFKDYRKIVDTRDKELEAVRIEYSNALNESSDALNKIFMGDPSIRISETSSTYETINTLKRMVNLNAQNYGEIVDQAHEFAITLAEHFDVLNRVSKGDFDARITGDSQVELLESLKKLTNKMIENTSIEISRRKDMEEELKKSRDELEIRVNERTKQLARSNEFLNNEIIERKKAEEEIKKRRDYLEAIMNSSLDLIVTIKKDGNIKYANRIIKDLLYYEPENVKGRSFLEFIPQELHHTAIEKWNEMQKGITGVFEIKVMRADGTSLDCLISHSSLGDLGEYLTIIKDITEHKRAEELYLQNVHLEYVNKSKSEFLATMSHELRTPLNAVIGFSELLKMKGPGDLNEKQERYIDNITISGRHLLDLINNILDLTKIEAGKMDLAIQNVNIGGIINEAIILLGEKLTKQKIVIKKEFDSQLDKIDIDPLRFKQVVFNLLSNAVKFSKEEGGIILIITKKEGDRARISISDTGIGIKENDIGRLFTKFQQVDSGTTRKYGGTGLGLAISKQLIELHGGKILVESKFGEGATFTILIPVIQTMKRTT